MGLEKIAAGVGKFAKSAGAFLYETSKGIVKGVGKAIYETGKGAYKGIKAASDSPLEEGALEKLDSSSFLNDLRGLDIPKKDYKNLASLVSRDAYNSLSDADRIEKSLNLLDRMYNENYIGMKTHKKLKKSLYREFERVLKGKNNYNRDLFFDSPAKKYLSLTTSLLLLLSGAFLLKPSPTGLLILDNLGRINLNFLGIISFLVGITLLGFFVRKMRK